MIRLDQCHHCNRTAQHSAPSTHDRNLWPPGPQQNHVLQGHTSPNATRRPVIQGARRVSGTQQPTMNSNVAQRRVSVGQQQRLAYAAGRQGRSSPSSTRAMPITSRRPTQYSPNLAASGQYGVTSARTNSYSPTPYGTFIGDLPPPYSEYASSSISSLSLVAPPAPASTSYGTARAYETPPSPYYSPSSRPAGLSSGTTPYDSSISRQPDDLRDMGEHMSHDLSTIDGTHAQGDSGYTHDPLPELLTGPDDSWMNIDLDDMPGPFIPLDDFEPHSGFDAASSAALVSQEVDSNQQPPPQIATSRSVPQWVNGATWGGHRLQPTSPSLDVSFDTTTLTVPTSPSVASSTGPRKRRTGAQLRDPSLPYRCAQCATTFPTEGELQRHARKHTQDKPHHCPECGRGFDFPKDVRRHQLIHNPMPSVPCTKCGKVLNGNRSDNWARHFQLHHPGEPIPKIDFAMAQQASSSAMPRGSMHASTM